MCVCVCVRGRGERRCLRVLGVSYLMSAAACPAGCISMVAGLCHVVFSSFRGERTPREKTKRRKTPCEKTKRRNNTMRKDEKTKPATLKEEISSRKDKKKKKKKTNKKTKKKKKNAMRKYDKIKVSNGVFSHGVFSSFCVEISLLSFSY